jgi:hypothetical protein
MDYQRQGEQQPLFIPPKLAIIDFCPSPSHASLLPRRPVAVVIPTAVLFSKRLFSAGEAAPPPSESSDSRPLVEDKLRDTFWMLVMSLKAAAVAKFFSSGDISRGGVVVFAGEMWATPLPGQLADWLAGSVLSLPVADLETKMKQIKNQNKILKYILWGVPGYILAKKPSYHSIPPYKKWQFTLCSAKHWFFSFTVLSFLSSPFLFQILPFSI